MTLIEHILLDLKSDWLLGFVPAEKYTTTHTCTSMEHHIFHHHSVCTRSTSLEARLPLLFWLSLPDAFCRCFSLKHFACAGMQTSTYSIACTPCCTPAHYRMHANTTFHGNLFIYTHVPPPPRDSSNTRAQAHTQSTPTTPGWWTTSAYPPLRPCPWRGCWLPPGCTATMSSLSAITKMCSDNWVFFYTGPFPHISLGPEGPARTETYKTMPCHLPRLLEVFIWFGRATLHSHDGLYFYVVKV